MVGPLMRIHHPEQMKRLIREKLKAHLERTGKKLRGSAFETKVEWLFAKHWKGPGYYYHRGKGVFSRYSEKRDRNYKTKIPNPRKKHRWHAFQSVGTGPYRQTYDHKPKRKKRGRSK